MKASFYLALFNKSGFFRQSAYMTFLFAPAFFADMVLCLSLIMAIGLKTRVIRMGLMRQHVRTDAEGCAC
jgi:hypothetical protein